ncbi:MAG: hypothetical protein OHK0013_10330 [Sandaracinaceae bacterium]
MQPTSCPRCAKRLIRVSLGLRSSGGYRDQHLADAAGYRCEHCHLGVVPGEVVDELMQAMPVGGGMSERERKRLRMGCPACMGSLDRVTLGWATEFVEIEQCPRCRLMLLDAGEFPKLFEIEHTAKG